MTSTPYYHLDNPKPNDPLPGPSHSTLHQMTGAAVETLHTRVSTLELAAPVANENIRQARMAAHEWFLRGPLIPGPALLLPILWNLTGRTVELIAARATVYTPPEGGEIWVNIYLGSVMPTDGQVNSGVMDPVTATPLVIPTGQQVSSIVDTFIIEEMPVGSYLVAAVEAVGADSAGSDLTIQLNRLL